MVPLRPRYKTHSVVISIVVVVFVVVLVIQLASGGCGSLISLQLKAEHFILTWQVSFNNFENNNRTI